MIRRIAALIALLAIFAVLISLVWAVHRHRTRSADEQDYTVEAVALRITDSPVISEEVFHA